MFMGFAAIAVGIGIDAECHRQAGYAYAPEIYSIKTSKNELHLTQLI
ncbi:hypothetical protein [Nostoc sp.]